jgi:outer membrane protein assembly factor BamB
VVLAMVLGGHAAVVAEGGAEGGDEAAADAWPMFRGVLAGTGRSAARITLPLAERWHRQLEKTAFEATPVVSGGRIFVGDLDGTFHCLDLVDGKTVWSFKTDVGFPSAAAVSKKPAATPARLVLFVVILLLDLQSGCVACDARP